MCITPRENKSSNKNPRHKGRPRGPNNLFGEKSQYETCSFRVLLLPRDRDGRPFRRQRKLSRKNIRENSPFKFP